VKQIARIEMKRYRALKMIGIGILVVALFFALGFVVMALWNWLMPPIFGLHTITYWQAYGLLILSKILFGGLRGGGGKCSGGHNWRNRMAERWEKMTPEEREKFRQSMRGRWCGVPPVEPGV
jgi:hypothetical protein